MDIHRFDALIRRLEVTQPRRATFGRGLAALVGLSLALKGSEAAGKKKKKKKKKKCKPPPTCPEPPQPPNCAESCPTHCDPNNPNSDPIFCFTRADGPHLCGAGADPDCTETCSSDNDCIGTDRPYCTTEYFILSLNQTSTICGEPGAHCTKIAPCVV